MDDVLDAHEIVVPGLAVHVVERCGSTNTALLAGEFEPPCLLAAKEQTAGRGRRGRRWYSAHGAAATFSVARLTRRPVRELAGLSLVAGVAAAQALRALGATETRLKWPNDLVVGDRKLAGLLTESTPGEVTAVILGLGVNVTADAYPADLSGAATSCEEEAKGPVDRAELLVAVLTALEARYSAVLVKGGRETTMEAYRADSATIGRRVRVELPTGILDGTADRVAWNGQLIVVDDNGGQHVVNAGDVIHLRT